MDTRALSYRPRWSENLIRSIVFVLDFWRQSFPAGFGRQETRILCHLRRQEKIPNGRVLCHFFWPRISSPPFFYCIMRLPSLPWCRTGRLWKTSRWSFGFESITLPLCYNTSRISSVFITLFHRNEFREITFQRQFEQGDKRYVKM